MVIWLVPRNALSALCSWSVRTCETILDTKSVAEHALRSRGLCTYVCHVMHVTCPLAAGCGLDTGEGTSCDRELEVLRVHQKFSLPNALIRVVAQKSPLQNDPTSGGLQLNTPGREDCWGMMGRGLSVPDVCLCVFDSVPW